MSRGGDPVGISQRCLTLRRIVTFLIIAPYKYSYLLTYLLTHRTSMIGLPRGEDIMTIR